MAEGVRIGREGNGIVFTYAVAAAFTGHPGCYTGPVEGFAGIAVGDIITAANGVPNGEAADRRINERLIDTCRSETGTYALTGLKTIVEERREVDAEGHVATAAHGFTGFTREGPAQRHITITKVDP